jgi:hypothetical protein
VLVEGSVPCLAALRMTRSPSYLMPLPSEPLPAVAARIGDHVDLRPIGPNRVLRLRPGLNRAGTMVSIQ